MSTVLVIAAREIRERSRLFLVAVVLAVLPFLVALVPGARGNRSEAIMMIGGGTALTYAFALALALGVSTIGRDLREKRLSFYFSRPISPAELWLGKAGASLLVIVACLAIIALPSYLATSKAWRLALDFGTFAFVVPVSLVLFFLGMHAIGTMTRSRSALIALDFACAVVTAGVVVSILRSILAGHGITVAKVLSYGVVSGVLLLLATAPIWQLSRGRTDPRRSHAALSMFLWSGCAVLLLLTIGFFLWLRAVSPGELARIRTFHQAPASGWVFVTGIGAHRGDYRSSFLMNPATSESVRLAAPPFWDVVWSRDGRVMAWTEPANLRFPDSRIEIYTHRVGSKTSRATGIQTDLWSVLALSDDGSRIAVADEGTAVVHDLVHDRMLASVRTFGSMVRFSFVTNDLLRIIESRPVGRENQATLRISDLDLTTRAVQPRLERRLPVQNTGIWVSADGSRLLIRGTGEILDGRTLAPLLTIEPGWRGVVLSDGGLVGWDDRRATRLRFLDRDGRLRGTVALPGLYRPDISGETTDGKLLLNVQRTHEASRSAKGFAVVVVDVATLAVERVIPDTLGPVLHESRLPLYPAKRPILGLDGNGKLKDLDLWNPVASPQ